MKYVFALTALLTFPFLHAEEAVIHLKLAAEPTNALPEKIFGQFMERASWGEPGPEEICDENGVLDPEAFRLLQKLRPPVIRFPGGSDIDYIDWRDMIDNVPGRSGPGRPVTRGMFYSNREPGEHTISNRFGWDEYWAMQRKLGNETIVVLNFLDAAARRRPLREAALTHVGLLAYCNAPQGAELPEGMPDWPAVRAENGHAEPFGAEYVQIGNEWFLARWEKDVLIGLGLNPDLRGGELEPTPEQKQRVVAWMKEALLTYIRLIRQIDPDVKIIIDERMLFRVEREVLADPEIRREVALLAKHTYGPMSGYKVMRDGKKVAPGDLDPAAYWYQLSAMPGSYVDGLCQGLHRRDSEFVNMGYKMAYTEWNWNGWGWDQADDVVGFPHRNAVGLAVAAMYHGFFRDAAATELATQSMLIGKGWDIAAVNYSGKDGAPLHYGAQGQTSLFYRNHHGSQVLPVEIENNPVHDPLYKVGWSEHPVAEVDAVATVEGDTVYLHMVNRTFAGERKIRISGYGLAPDPSGTLYLMIPREKPADEPFRHFAMEQREVTLKDGMIRLPPRSISCLVIEK